VSAAVAARGRSAAADAVSGEIAGDGTRKGAENLSFAGRAYREFRGEPLDASWVTAATFGAICQVAKARGVEVEF